MCLIAFAIGASARWPLVIAANRDEFLNRPTQPLARWQTTGGQFILSGRDLKAGGTWLGMTPGGRVAFLTNVREAKPEAAPLSRGELVTGWLESGSDAAEFSASLQKRQHHYGGFNLVLGDLRRNAWSWMSNRPGGPQAGSWQFQALLPGIYGLSNAALDTPWPKTLTLKNALASALNQSENMDDTADGLQGLLWPALENRERSPRSNAPSTGVGAELEAALSSAFVDFPERGYGTVSSTLVTASMTAGLGSKQVLRIDMKEKTHFCAFSNDRFSLSSLTFNFS